MGYNKFIFDVILTNLTINKEDNHVIAEFDVLTHNRKVDIDITKRLKDYKINYKNLNINQILDFVSHNIYRITGTLNFKNLKLKDTLLLEDINDYYNTVFKNNNLKSYNHSIY